MKDWNDVITIFQDGYKRGSALWENLAPPAGSPCHNVLVITVADPLALLSPWPLRQGIQCVTTDLDKHERRTLA